MVISRVLLEAEDFLLKTLSLKQQNLLVLNLHFQLPPPISSYFFYVQNFVFFFCRNSSEEFLLKNFDFSSEEIPAVEILLKNGLEEFLQKKLLEEKREKGRKMAISRILLEDL